MNIDLSSVPSQLPKLEGNGIIFNTEETSDWLSFYSSLIGWTYSATNYFGYFKRLIVGQPNFKSPNRKLIRCALNCHIKCYIAPNEMLIGSYNLTYPTIEDCCVLVSDKRAITHMKQQFDKHWMAL